MKRAILIYFLIPFFGAIAVEPSFDHDLHLFSLPGSNRRTMICFHGYGDSYKIAQTVKELYHPRTRLVSFNFPEHGLKEGRVYDPKRASFGTIKELLPALYVMKKIVLDQGLDAVDLYGFSAGGGALINAIAVLNTKTHDLELKELGIGVEEKKRLLSAIQKGVIVLDTPLKSVEEIMSFRGTSPEFEILAQNYRDHDLRPIDSLKKLERLSLTILLHFQEEDEVLSNRDDALYIERLKDAQKEGSLTVIITNNGGHMAPHPALWEAYSQKTSD